MAAISAGPTAQPRISTPDLSVTMLRRLKYRLKRRLHGQPPALWYDRKYRLPMASIEAVTGIEPRRADYVLAYLLDMGLLERADLRQPPRISYRDLARVHSHGYLDSLDDPATLSRIFSVDMTDTHVQQTMVTMRLACGGTLAAARESLHRQGPTFNLLGGFHHAEPERGSGLCALNDIAVAVACLRSEGFSGQVAVVDLDAHPPDGTAACLQHDDKAWIGSLSGTDWGALAGVDETVLPPNTGDDDYLAALRALLERMPAAALAFVIAGGDVLEDDRFGALGLTLDGARQRDLLLAKSLATRPAVWLPGGGYHKDAWRLLASSFAAVSCASDDPIVAGYDSQRAHYNYIARRLDPRSLSGPMTLEEADFGVGTSANADGSTRLLGLYTANGIEHGLEHFGVLEHLRRLGYMAFRVSIRSEDERAMVRLHARHQGMEYLLMESVLERKIVADQAVLFVHWLTLQDGARRLQAAERSLPGQQHPGLGMARESGELLRRVARRLKLAGVAFAPSWYHMAYLSQHRSQFVDPKRQGRFEALLRDLGERPMRRVSQAMDAGEVLMNGNPYTWEADTMVHWLADPKRQDEIVATERERVHFIINPDRPVESPR